MKFLSHLKSAIQYMQLPRDQRRLTFYSEGRNYWPFLKGLVNELLQKTDFPICYISSDKDDPGLTIEHPNYRTFKIDEAFVRNWLFENMDTDVMVMTMPDLHQYQVKRSKHKVHYIYVQHSLVSLHMVYRKGAFDHYDTIFCAGPHHVKEVRAIEKHYGLPKKNILEHGYARLDDILKESESRPLRQTDETSLHYLLAPSWGPEGTIESGVGEAIVDQLIGQGHKVTLRPHPQTIKFAGKEVDDIVKKHRLSPNFTFESNVAGQDSLHHSDIMISDWSGAALDYAFGLGKPVMFIDVPRKINNSEYEKIEIEPFEVMIRGKIGTVHSPNNFFYEKQPPLPEVSINSTKAAFNVRNSACVGADYICEILEGRSFKNPSIAS